MRSLTLVRVRRAHCLWLAAGALFLALVWPFGELAHASLAAHMAQHMLLIGVAAPFVVLARASLPLLRGSRFCGRLLRIPAGIAFALHAAAIWACHAPAAIELARAHHGIRVLEHAVLVGTALLFWWSLLRPGRAGFGAASLWSLATLQGKLADRRRRHRIPRRGAFRAARLQPGARRGAAPRASAGAAHRGDRRAMVVAGALPGFRDRGNTR